jgi:hypothetical protein
LLSLEIKTLKELDEYFAWSINYSNDWPTDNLNWNINNLAEPTDPPQVICTLQAFYVSGKANLTIFFFFSIFMICCII